MIKARWSQNILLAVLAVVLLLLTSWGWGNGYRAAQSKRIVKDAKMIAVGFSEFHKDQNRYPATTEFDDINVMKRYITNFPPQSFPSGVCAKSFEYFNASPQTYELRFCLPKAVNGYNIGWNVLKP